MCDCSCSRASSFSICLLVSLMFEHTVFMACRALWTAGWSGCLPGVLLASSWSRGGAGKRHQAVCPGAGTPHSLVHSLIHLISVSSPKRLLEGRQQSRVCR
jgi:hypothetical protein